MNQEELKQLQDLCEAAVEGRLTPQTQERLERIVLESAEARRFYVAYLHQHAALQWSTADLTPAPRPAPLDADELAESAPPSVSAPSRTRKRWALKWLGTIAAAMAASLLVVFWLKRPQPGPLEPIARQESPEGAQASEPLDFTVAVLAYAPGAEWADAEAAPRTGTPLPPGWLRLKAGYAQLEFYSGATVILEGPADLQLLSRMEAYCERGKLRVTVPPHAQGFAIRTPKVELVDLGTEFGVQVDEGKGTEIQVFQGKVELYDAGSNRGEMPRDVLSTGQGLLVSEPGETRPVASDPSAFRTARELAAQTEVQMRRRHEQWLADSLSLRKDPSLVAYYSFQAEEAWSRTLLDEAGDREVAHDGAIVGCTWGEGRWPLKQALEFKQVSDRVRVNIPGEFDSITLAAWVRIDGLPNLNNSLLMADGWDPGEVHWQLVSGGMLVLGVQSEPKGKGWHYDAPDVLTPDYFGRWIQLALVYNKDAALVTHYLNGRPVLVQSIPMDIPLRFGETEIGNWNISTLHNSTPVRYFTGAIDELMIFSRALREQEIEGLYTQGQPTK
jgi:hypothetical protein